MATSPRRTRRQVRAAAPCRDDLQGVSSTSVRDRCPCSSRRAGDAAGVLPDDLYDYYAAEPDPRRGPSTAVGRTTWRVTYDWPDRMPVTETEIEVFERWFADLFDELFGPVRR